MDSNIIKELRKENEELKKENKNIKYRYSTIFNMLNEFDEECRDCKEESIYKLKKRFHQFLDPKIDEYF